MSTELWGTARPTGSGWLSRMEPWTDDRPDPGHWLATMGLERARCEVQKALRTGRDPIVVSGPAGHGKTLLLRSLRTRPPGGLEPIFVPFSNVEPDALAGWILEAAHRRLERRPAARLVQLLRANARSSGGTLLLMDEVQATSCATLSRLFEIIGQSQVAVSVVLAGLAGEALDLTLTAVPYPTRKVEVSEPWGRADAGLLLARVARDLRMDPFRLLSAVDVDAALSDGAGNPRLVRAALAARLRLAEPDPERSPRVAPFPRPQPSAQLAVPAPLDCTSPDAAPPTSSARVPVAARSHRTPSLAPRMAQTGRLVARRVAARFHRTPSLAPRMAQTGRLVARRLRGIRAKRGREWIAASWTRLTQVLAPGCIRLQRSTATGAHGVRTWLDRTASRAQLVRGRALRAIGTRGHRMGIAVRARTHALAARLRSLSLACGESAWEVAREWAWKAQATAVRARPALDRAMLQGLTAAAKLLRRAARLLPDTARSALVIAGATAALAALVAAGPMRVPALAGVSKIGSEAIPVAAVELLPFRVNSHPWASVAIDGVDAGSTPFTIPLEPGPHHFRVAMADGRILEQVVVVSPTQDRLALR